MFVFVDLRKENENTKNYASIHLYKGTHSCWGIYGNIILISNLKISSTNVGMFY